LEPDDFCELEPVDLLSDFDDFDAAISEALDDFVSLDFGSLLDLLLSDLPLSDEAESDGLSAAACFL
jgi:hypothetical protein